MINENRNGKQKIKSGNIVYGVVKSIKPYGAFVQIDEKHTGLLRSADSFNSSVHLGL